MIPVLKDRRARIALIVIFLGALVLTLPMRLALGAFGLDKAGMAARDMSGSVWMGRIEALKVANVDVGTVAAGLSPVQLPIGRARMNLGRRMGRPDDLKGAISLSASSFGIDDATASLPLGGLLAPMPLRAVDLSDVSVRFDHGRCSRAQGRVRMHVGAAIPGMALAQGLSGDALCSGDDLMLPLASQSGMEQINIRVTADGRYHARFIVQKPAPDAAAVLSGSGFAPSGEALVLAIDGSL